MSDQAEKLRQMVSEGAFAPPPDRDGPPLIAVTGGKRGVGTTTVAINLGAALADRGRRVVVVDASRHRDGIVEAAGMPIVGGGALSDVLGGKLGVEEALAPGPAGTLLLADRWSPRARGDFGRVAQERLLRELRAMANAADIVIVDTGSAYSQWVERFWRQASAVLLPMLTDDASVMETYATLKAGSTGARHAETFLLVNQCDEERLARDVASRLTTACQRFLGRRSTSLPHLPSHLPPDGSPEAHSPRIWEDPTTPFGHAFLWIAKAVDEAMVPTAAKV